jgi:hypothetical protein
MFNLFKKKPSKEVQDNLEDSLKISSKSDDIVIRYTYDWSDDVPLNERIPCNPFCEKMMEIAKTKVWSRSDIENISLRLGYSVWDRRGFWVDQGHKDENGEPIETKWIKNGVEVPYCKHEWKTKILKRK